MIGFVRAALLYRNLIVIPTARTLGPTCSGFPACASRDNWAPILVLVIITSLTGICKQCGRISDLIIGCFFYEVLQSLIFTFLLVELGSMQIILPTNNPQAHCS
jgi:hypothetical protein